jgi:hypothetical protein
VTQSFTGSFAAVAAIILLLCASAHGQSTDPVEMSQSVGVGVAGKNVIFTISDDFNHWLPAVGYYLRAWTRNLDTLAKQEVLLANASSASPICNSFRQSL